MEVYNIKFSMPYIEADVFKQKHYDILLSLIGNSRLAENMHYDGPGLMTFAVNDSQHNNPIVTPMDKYNRLKTNCLIFSLPSNNRNMGYYDKLFIYYSAGVKIAQYGYVLFNTETNKCQHIYFIDDDYNDLLRCLNQTFNRLSDESLFAFYSKKYDAIQGRNGFTIDDAPRAADYETMINERKNRAYNVA